MPAHNSEATIMRALESVFAQTVPITRILIFDDASRDQTPRILKQAAATDSRIHVIRSDENVGPGVARRTLLDRCDTPYAAFLDADDEWLPRKTELQLAAFEQPDVIAVYSSIEVHEPGRNARVRRVAEHTSWHQLHRKNDIPTSSAIVRLDVDGARAMPSLKKRQDYGYWFQLAKRHSGKRFVGLQVPLAKYHVTPGSVSSNPLKNLYWNYRMFRDVAAYPPMRCAWHVSVNVVERLKRREH